MTTDNEITQKIKSLSKPPIAVDIAFVNDTACMGFQFEGIDHFYVPMTRRNLEQIRDFSLRALEILREKDE
jgi:hypothetical protein